MSRMRKISGGAGRSYNEINWKIVLEEYLGYKKATNIRDITLKGYKDVISLFYKRYPEATKDEKLETAVYSFLSERIKPATYNIRRNYLKQFFDWCVEKEIYRNNPLKNFKKQKDEGRIVIIHPDKLEKLISLPNTKTFAGLRDLTLILFTLDNGVRPSEAFSLLKNDFNLNKLEAYVQSDVSKTKSFRILPISPATARMLRRLIQVRHPDWTDDVPVFCTADGTRLTNDVWGDRLEKYSKELGIRIRPYDLRHTFAIQYLRNGGDPFVLRKIMGHTSMDMTMRYVHLVEEDIKEWHSVASPVKTLFMPKHRLRKITASPNKRKSPNR